MAQVAKIKHFFDEQTNSYSYVVSDKETLKCAIIDSVLDYDAASATTKTNQADRIIAYIQKNKMQVEWILETHVHADHLTASQYLKSKLGGRTAISKKIEIVQDIFAPIYNIDIKKINVNQPFDYLFEDHENFKIGEIDAYNIPTPGHTPACLSYVIGNAVFIGDTLFMPDYGTARCDFPKGSAAKLYDSVQKLYELPENTKLYLCHDYLPETREKYQYKTTIKEQKENNIHLNKNTSKKAFIKLREKRDALLNMPRLILPAIQINMNAGKYPEKEDNGIGYLKIPFNYFK
jgi:glyoxylase-like metal-dependent hydrolase (beta-lactamase superfamily II)